MTDVLIIICIILCALCLVLLLALLAKKRREGDGAAMEQLKKLEEHLASVLSILSSLD